MVNGDNKYWFENESDSFAEKDVGKTGESADVSSVGTQADDVASDAGNAAIATAASTAADGTAENQVAAGGAADAEFFARTDGTGTPGSDDGQKSETDGNDSFFGRDIQGGYADYMQGMAEKNDRNASGETGADGGSRHDNHYRSEFAARSGGRDDAPIKSRRVRGFMLKKLLKYDYRSLLRFLLPCYIALLALAVLCAILLKIGESVSISDGTDPLTTTFYSTLVSTVVFYIIGVAACSIVCFINIATRFYKNFFSEEGYLTLSIPASPEEHIFSKLISGFTTSILTGIVALLSVVIVVAPYWATVMPALGEAFGELFEAIGELFRVAPGHAIFYTIEIILVVILSSIFSLQVIYSSICIGHLFVNKNRKGTAGMSFVVYLALSQIISTLLSFTNVLNFFFGSPGGLHLFFWLLILLYGGGSVGLFFLERHIMTHKINLG